MYEQWGNRIISKINMWENSKEFKSINVLLRGGNHNEKILSIRILSKGVY